MKTSANSIADKLGKGILLVGALAIIITSCTQVDSPFGVQETDVKSFEDLNINVKYAESYDQTVTTFSRLWPEGISAGFRKGKISEGGELLVDYERTHEVLAFDEDGYMNSVSEFLEGDGEMNMPEEAFNKLKSTMPARANDYDPVVKTVMVDGSLNYFSKSGELVFSYPIDKELYRVDPSSFDSLQNNNTETGQSVKNNLFRLENSGILFDRIGDNYVKFEQKANKESIAEGIAKEEFVLDLRNGNTIAYASIKPNGDYISIIRSSFNIKGGLSVLASEEHVQFGLINKDWGIIGRTKMTRENIKVILN